ncbi:hypothetical protein PsorP6_010874 [Peronosclerospora sorghi]|uniref:Uncharacterized protein n=1 Tax=Peronosclerospora sorghi TaxID=230839 RepID=A0ACC0VW77_9STRA|nr:hypothetical protein PsorP6_010874 [Peronosclerospora sorghi]
MFCTRAIRVTIARGFLPAQSGGHYASLCSIDRPQMGERLTRQEIGERRAKRAERQAVDGGEALFIEGSLRPYRRHFVIVEPAKTDPLSWPKRLEQTPDHILYSYKNAVVQFYHGDVKEAKTCPLLVTAAIPYADTRCEEVRKDADKQLNMGTHDILVFPDAVRVHDIVPSQSTSYTCDHVFRESSRVGLAVEACVRNHYYDCRLMSNGAKTDALFRQQEPAVLASGDGLPHDGVRPCCKYMDPWRHGCLRRDERCGCKGPQLLHWLKEFSPRMKKPVNLWTSSHYGGHRYAASFIVYPSGDWFGFLNDKETVEKVLSALNDDNPLQMHELWRGRMGLTVHRMRQVVKERVEDKAR